MESQMKFPLAISHGSVTVKIYRTQHRKMKAGVLFQVAWTGANGRVLKQFAKLDEAKRYAATIAARIQAGRAEGTEVNRNDLDLLREIREICADVSPALALREWRRACDLTDGHLLEAAQAWASRRKLVKDTICVSDALALFLQAKQAANVDVKTAYKNRLHLFAAQLKAVQVADVTTPEINAYLQGFSHPVTRNTHRKNIVTFFRWCKRQGYLPQDQPSPAENSDRAQEQDTEVAIFAPEDFASILRLIATEHPHYLPALILAGFCGLRRNEVHAQKWEDIDLQKNFLSVSKAKPRTPRDRIVPICTAAQQWLALVATHTTGMVCHNLAMDRVRDIARDKHIKTPDNGFRHSFITYAIALESTGKVAQWAGNTERIIHRHYRKPVREQLGHDWFNLTPARVMNT